MRFYRAHIRLAMRSGSLGGRQDRGGRGWPAGGWWSVVVWRYGLVSFWSVRTVESSSLRGVVRRSREACPRAGFISPGLVVPVRVIAPRFRNHRLSRRYSHSRDYTVRLAGYQPYCLSWFVGVLPSFPAQWRCLPSRQIFHLVCDQWIQRWRLLMKEHNQVLHQYLRLTGAQGRLCRL